jgi:hypothetical protein
MAVVGIGTEGNTGGKGEDEDEDEEEEAVSTAVTLTGTGTGTSAIVTFFLVFFFGFDTFDGWFFWAFASSNSICLLVFFRFLVGRDNTLVGFFVFFDDPDLRPVPTCFVGIAKE